MNKKELTEALVGYGFTEEELEGKTNAVLGEMLKEAQEQANTQTEEVQVAEGGDGSEGEASTEDQGTKEDSEEDNIEAQNNTQAEEGEQEPEALRVSKVQLLSVKEFIYVVRHRGAKVKIANVGHGDVYVGGEVNATIGKLSQQILRGEEMVVEGLEAIRMISSSSPVVEISELE